MQQDTRSILVVIYENRRGYNGKPENCIAPRMWLMGQIVQHIISVRAGWFSYTLQDTDEVMNE